MNGELTKIQAAINVLLTGDAVSSADIAQRVTSETDKQMNDKEAATLMTKLQKTDLGNLIQRKREGRRFIFSMVPEALNMEPDQTYGLSRKTGKDRYTLDQALSDYSELGKYIKKKRAPIKRRASRKTDATAPGKTETPAWVEEEPEADYAEAKAETQTYSAPPQAEKPAKAETGGGLSVSNLEKMIVGLFKAALTGGRKDVDLNVNVTHDVQVTVKIAK